MTPLTVELVEPHTELVEPHVEHHLLHVTGRHHCYDLQYYIWQCVYWLVKWRRRHKDGMNKERGKECSEVSEQYNIGPLHTCPKQHMWEHAAICTHNCLDTPDFFWFGTQLCMCSHVLFGTGAEWPYTAWRLLNTLFLHLLVLPPPSTCQLCRINFTVHIKLFNNSN